MKPAAYIITILMLLFMAQPMLIQCQVQKQAIPSTGCCGGNSCHKKETPGKTENKGCDRANACNPFASCSQCQYLAVSKFFYRGKLVQTVKNSVAPATEDIVSGYINDCWHPPEFDQV